MNDSTPSRRLVLQEDAFPDLPVLMHITLDPLRALGGSATNQEIVDYVIEKEGISEA
jgi:hypothetical protein